MYRRGGGGGHVNFLLAKQTAEPTGVRGAPAARAPLAPPTDVESNLLVKQCPSWPHSYTSLKHTATGALLANQLRATAAFPLTNR